MCICFDSDWFCEYFNFWCFEVKSLKIIAMVFDHVFSVHRRAIGLGCRLTEILSARCSPDCNLEEFDLHIDRLGSAGNRVRSTETLARSTDLLPKHFPGSGSVDRPTSPVDRPASRGFSWSEFGRPNSVSQPTDLLLFAYYAYFAFCV